MRRGVRITLRIVALFAVIALAAIAWKREELSRLWAVNTLFEEERIVANFSDMGRMFPTVPVPRGDGPVTPLPAGAPGPLPDDLPAWIEARGVTALVVLHDGRIVHEGYYLGTGEGDLRISWSIAKSFLSALTGMLIDEGALSLDDPVTRHVPALTGGAYDGATVGDVLHMASGVAFDENVTDFNSDISRMGRVLALGRSMDGFAEGLEARAGPPGEAWRYVSIDTHVLGMVVRGATGRTIPDLMSEKVVAPLGLESQPYYVTDGFGEAFVLGGLNMTTRDYARFGQMYLDGGRVGGHQIVPADWVEASTRPRAPAPANGLGYGYQWWVPPDPAPGEFFAEGIYGQYVYVNRPAGVVIAVNAADRDFRGKTVANIDVFRRIAAAVSAPAGRAVPGRRRGARPGTVAGQRRRAYSARTRRFRRMHPVSDEAPKPQVIVKLRSFSRSLPMSLLLAREALLQRFRSSLHLFNITEQQWRVLRALNTVPEIEVTALAKATYLLPPSLSRILRGLEERGLILRKPAEGDMRKSLIAISEDGLRLIDAVTPCSDEIYGEITSAFGEAKLARLQELLKELTQVANALPPVRHADRPLPPEVRALTPARPRGRPRKGEPAADRDAAP